MKQLGQRDKPHILKHRAPCKGELASMAQPSYKRRLPPPHKGVYIYITVILTTSGKLRFSLTATLSVLQGFMSSLLLYLWWLSTVLVPTIICKWTMVCTHHHGPPKHKIDKEESNVWLIQYSILTPIEYDIGKAVMLIYGADN